MQLVGGMVGGKQRSFDASEDRQYYRDGVQHIIRVIFRRLLTAQFQLLPRVVNAGEETSGCTHNELDGQKGPGSPVSRARCAWFAGSP